MPESPVSPPGAGNLPSRRSSSAAFRRVGAALLRLRLLWPEAPYMPRLGAHFSPPSRPGPGLEYIARAPHPALDRPRRLGPRSEWGHVNSQSKDPDSAKAAGRRALAAASAWLREVGPLPAVPPPSHGTAERAAGKGRKASHACSISVTIRSFSVFLLRFFRL